MGASQPQRRPGPPGPRRPGPRGPSAGPGGPSSWGCAGGSRGAWARGPRRRPPTGGTGSSPDGPGRCPSGGRAWPRRRGPRPGSWSTGCPSGPPPAGPSPPGADGRVGLDAEDLGLEVDRAELGALHVAAGDRAGARARGAPCGGGPGAATAAASVALIWTPPARLGALTESRSTTTPPRGPGTAPLTRISSRSGSAETTSRFRAVTWRPPMRPAIRVPLKTRDGVAQAPIDPGTRWVLWLPWEAPWPLKLCRFMPPAKPLPLDTAMASTRSPGAHGVGRQLLADLVVADVVEAQLDQLAARVDPGRLEVALLGLGQRRGPAEAPGHLQGRVARRARGVFTCTTRTGATLQHRHRDGAVLVVPDLGHADLLADDRLACHVGASLL